MLDSGFYRKLIQVAANVGMKPEDILNVMAVESGLNPAAHNRNGNASGLTQFMPKTLKMLGFTGTHDQFRELDAIAQLDYVEKLIQKLMKINGGPFTSAAQYYVGNFLPAALRLPGVRARQPETVIVAKEPTQPHLPGVTMERESVFYHANAGLDYDKDGQITYGDIEKVLASKAKKSNFHQAVAQLQQIPEYQQSVNQAPDVTTPNPINTLLDSYLKSVFKTATPRQLGIVKIQSNKFTDAMELARFISLALNEELSAITSIHTDNQHVEVGFEVPGASELCKQASQQLVNALTETFLTATASLGKLNLNYQVCFNKRSTYPLASVNQITREQRSFLLKFV